VTVTDDGTWFVYVLRCGDGSLYTGVAKDVAARLAQHSAGKGARYTRGRGPLELLAKGRCRGRGEALRVEIAFKGLTRDDKLRVLGSRGLMRFVRSVREKIAPSRRNRTPSAKVRAVCRTSSRR
jgi:putative endonuclease